MNTELKRADILKIRTNLINVLQTVFLPLVLAISIFMFDIDTVATNILKGSFNISHPSSIINQIEKESNAQTNKIDANESPKTEHASSNTVFTVSSDVQKLINEAEEKYKNSANDGEISAEDYSLKNATNEYNGIYLRNTTPNNQNINIGEYLNKELQIKVEKVKPVVLVYHTHTSETYELLDRGFYTNERDTRSQNPNENMIRVGEELCSALEKQGYKAIHDTTVYDESLAGAYDRARENISKILKENPSIQVVLDVHRDSIYLKDGTRVKTVSQINGDKVAQIKITTGCEDGNVTDFGNWQKNLTFALKLQESLTREAPSSAQPLNLACRKYNMDLMPNSLHIEIGTDANTLTEALNSANILANALANILKEY